MSTFRPQKDYIKYYDDHIDMTSPKDFFGIPKEAYDVVKTETVWTMFEMVRRITPCQKFLGTRQYDMEKKVYTEYKYLTYQDAHNIALKAANSFAELGMEPEDVVCQCMKNRAEYMLSNLGMFRQGGCNSPLRAELDSTYYETIVIQTLPKFAVVDCEKLEEYIKMCENIKAKGELSVKVIIVLGYVPGPNYGKESLPAELANRAKALGVKALTWEDFLKVGEGKDHPMVPQDPSRPHSILFTSGTTSNQPKGVVLPHRSYVTHSCRTIDLFFNANATHYSFINTAHVSEGSIEAVVSCRGGVICYASNGLANFMEDIEKAHPTVLCLAPVIIKKLYNNAMAAMKAGVPEKAVNAAMIQKLGGRCDTIIAFGAPTGKELANWVIHSLNMGFASHYGLTEAGSAPLMTGYLRVPPTAGGIGVPTELAEIRIINEEELGYHITDEHPHGELLVKSPGNMLRYLNNPEKTKATIDEEGWLHTNDIVELTPEGTLTLIDRKDNMIKTATAAYIPMEKIESLLSLSDVIAQSWVHGERTDHFITAVIVPDFEDLVADKRVPENLKEACAKALKNPAGPEAAKLCESEEIRGIVMEEIKKIGEEFHFPYYWDIKGILLEPIRWTEPAGLITYTNKLKRKALVAKYRPQLDVLQAELRKTVALKYI